MHSSIHSPLRTICYEWHGNSFFIIERDKGRSPFSFAIEFDANSGRKLRTIRPQKEYELCGDITAAEDGTIYAHAKRPMLRGEFQGAKTPLQLRRAQVVDQVGRHAILVCPRGAEEFQLLAEMPTALRKRTAKNLVVSNGYIYFADRAPDFLYPSDTHDPHMGEAIYRLPIAED